MLFPEVNGMEQASFWSIPRVLALVCVFPLAVAFLWLTGRCVVGSLRVVRGWQPANAVVVGDAERETLVLELSLAGETRHQVVRRDAGFGSPAQGTVLPVYVDPATRDNLRQNNFADLWLNAVMVGAFAVLLTAAGVFMWRSNDAPDLSHMSDEGEWAAQQPLSAADTAGPRDDGSPIEIHEPGQSWKANVFWGLLFGLLLVIPPLFAPPSVAAWKKYGLALCGLAWMSALGVLALRNYARKVRLEGGEVVVSTPLSSRRFPLSDVKRVTRTDVRKQLAALRDVGRSSRKSTPFDTSAPLILYVLYDGQGRTLLRLDKDMTPEEEMTRFLGRLEKVAGPIRTD